MYHVDHKIIFWKEIEFHDMCVRVCVREYETSSHRDTNRRRISLFSVTHNIMIVSFTKCVWNMDARYDRENERERSFICHVVYDINQKDIKEAINNFHTIN